MRTVDLYFPPITTDPTTNQLKFIRSIEKQTGAKFAGKTYDDASLFIDKFREIEAAAKDIQKRYYRY